MYCPYSNCESLSEFAQAEAIDATFTGVFAQVIHLHQAVHVAQNKSNWCLLRLKPWEPHSPVGLANNCWLAVYHKSHRAGTTRLHVTRRTHTHPHQQLIQLFEPCGRLHMDWQSASTGAFLYFLSDWPTVWAGPAYTQAFKSHNGLQVTQKIHRRKHSGSCLGSWD